jgi:class 3 adenylate cyclase
VAHDVISSTNCNAHNIREVYEAFSLTITSISVGTAANWPFVTIPNFEAQCLKLINRTGSQQVSFSPLVTEAERVAWEKYSVEYQGWLQDSLDLVMPQETAEPIIEYIWQNGATGVDSPTLPVPEDRPPNPYYAPFWQSSPAPVEAVVGINRNANDFEYYARAFADVKAKNVPILTEVLNLDKEDETPVTLLVTPVYTSSQMDAELVGIVGGIVEWRHKFAQILPEGVKGIILVVKNACNQAFTFEVNGPSVVYLGPEDLHDHEYDNSVIIDDLDAIDTVDGCTYTLHVYPSEEFRNQYETSRPLFCTLTAFFIFLSVALVFLLYDWTVERRQESLAMRAVKTDALVNSLFPANVRDRLIQQGGDESEANGKAEEDSNRQRAKYGLNQYDNMNEDETGVFTTKPIADLFPNATVMFADIVGFTAWSSTREPSQVFTLLETIYNAFDKIAKRRRVFKVETIGDSYLAVSGVPDAREDHALVMARFANDCLYKMKQVVQSLEITLGPDTAELTMRFGLHSGPVTAGVLRGEKSRFQLFGDTVNTASRIEASGEKNKIHISSETADHLLKFGKTHWVKRRENMVQAKGKGEIQTYWLSVSGQAKKGQANSSVVSFADRPIELISRIVMDNKVQRLIGWNVDVLKRQLRQVLAMRDPSTISPTVATILDADDKTMNTRESDSSKIPSFGSIQVLEIELQEGATVLDEVKEIITLPSDAAAYKIDPYSIEFSPAVISQLNDYVTAIAQMYRDNPFHSFEHASHVTMSVCKLLSRVVTQESVDYQNMEVTKQGQEETHRYTYGITSDPICQFACAFSALIHDVDHTGVTNAMLVNENAAIAQHYKNKSVAEQNSVDLAWELLMEPQYSELRSCIYTTQDELTRFRQLLVNSVMATDIADKELGAARKKRWEKAFSSQASPTTSESEMDVSNRKATIVIEHLIQASDVSHTMQHWCVYLKWNERLFQEMYKTYKEGRLENDPSENWYKSEIGFFDFYLIPLAKKLKDCGVFGVASDEYLTYVQANRREWEIKGREVVKGYLEHYGEELGEE